MRGVRIPVLCTLLSGAGFYLSTNLGGTWWLAWFAPVPVLWLALGKTNPVVVLHSAFAASALGGLNLLPAYFGVIPDAALTAAIALSAIAFAACVMLARYTGRCLTPMAAPVTFASAWAAWDYIASLGPDGAISSPAYSQAAVPIFIQGAALAGPWIVTFVIGATAGLAALAFQRRQAIGIVPALALFTANLAFGAVHLEQAKGPEKRVVLISADAIAETSAIDRADLALGAILAYAQEIRLTARGADLVVLPEKIAVLRPAWRDEAFAMLQGAARFSGATIVAGFESRGPDGAQNIAWTITPGATTPKTYVQSTDAADPAKGFAVAISHDMNFQSRLRERMVRERPMLVAAPAWDFGTDGAYQARVAILRSVESGFALARTARTGRLTLSDAQGRLAAMRETSQEGFSVLTGTLAAAPDAGGTLYDRAGDVFAWFCVLLTAGLVMTGLARMVTGNMPARDLRTRPFGAILRPVWMASPGPSRPPRTAKI